MSEMEFIPTEENQVNPIEYRKVFLTGEINDQSYIDFVKEFKAFEITGNYPIEIYVNSEGGDFHSSVAIYDMITNSRCPVIIKCYGKCWSGASLIMQAGTVRVMSKHSVMMLHYGTRGYSGHAEDFQRWGDYNKRTKKIMFNLYNNKIKNKKKTEDLLLFDSMLSAKECKKLNLIDKIE